MAGGGGLEEGTLRISLDVLYYALQLGRGAQLLIVFVIVILLSVTPAVHRQQANTIEKQIYKACLTTNTTISHDAGCKILAHNNESYTSDNKYLVEGPDVNINELGIIFVAVTLPITLIVLLVTWTKVWVTCVRQWIPFLMVLNSLCMCVTTFLQWMVLYCSEYIGKVIVLRHTSANDTVVMWTINQVVPLDSDMHCQLISFSFAGLLALISAIGFAIDAVFSFQIRHVLDDDYDDSDDEHEDDMLDELEMYDKADDTSTRDPDLPRKTRLRGLTDTRGRVTFDPVAVVAQIPNSPNAADARKSFKKSRDVSVYDRRRKEMVHDVIYRIGGHVLDPQNKKRKIYVPPGAAKKATRRKKTLKIKYVSGETLDE